MSDIMHDKRPKLYNPSKLTIILDELIDRQTIASLNHDKRKK